MNALSLLADQHHDVDRLFVELAHARSSQRKRRLFEELADKLAAHAGIEETRFYPAVRARTTEALLREATEEHLAIKRVLADLLELAPSDPHFDARLAVVKAQVSHHAHEEEEAVLFPRVRQLLSPEELDALGGEMLREFEERMVTQPRRDLPYEIAAAAGG